MISSGAQRLISRWVHILFGMPVVGYVYSPFDAIPDIAPLVRFVFMPVLLASGLWMWKGHWARRLITAKRAS